MNEQLDILGARLTELIVAYKGLETQLAESREECATLKVQVSDLENKLVIANRQLESAEADITSKNDAATALLKQIENILTK